MNAADTALSVIDAANRGDVEAVVSACAPEFEFTPVGIELDQPTYRGVDAFARWGTVLRDFVDDLRFEAVRAVRVGDDGAVVFAVTSGQSREHGVPVEFRTFDAFETRDGLLVRCLSCREPGEAFDALGVGLGFRIFDAAQRGDVEELARLTQPDVRFRSALVGSVEGIEYQGHDDIPTYLAELRDAFETVTWRVDAIDRLGPDRLVVDTHFVARGRGSGLEVAIDTCAAIEERDGRIARQVIHQTRDAAVSALT